MVNIRTLSLFGFDPLDFFSKLSEREKSIAYFTSGAWTIVAWNPVRTVRRKNRAIFDALEREQRKRSRAYAGSLPFIGGAIGWVDHDADKKGGMFHVYDRAVLWNGTKLVIVGGKSVESEVRIIHDRAPLSAKKNMTISPLHNSGEGLGVRTEKEGVRWQPSITRSDYAKAFRCVKRDIVNGEYYQMNLTYTLQALWSGRHRTLFANLLRRNPAACASYIEDGRSAILSLSPERFITVDRGVITTRPIKGTRPRGGNSVDDRRQAEALLASPKEAAELNMITDLLRNDIGQVSEIGSVRVKEHRALQKNPTVWHTYSVIEGRLRFDVHPVRALQSVSPGGSVTGCPKGAAMKRIRELEKEERGPYCGSMLMLSDHGSLDSTMLIRTIVADGKRLSLGIGGGIVADSVLEDEWQETRQKAKAFMPSPLDPSNPDAVGVFETMRVRNGSIDDLDAHLRRLRRSAKLLGMKLSQSIATIRLRLLADAATSRLPLARLKVVCTSDDVLTELNLLHIDPREQKGISVTCVPCRRALPEAKALPYVREWRAHEEARQKGFDEALLMTAAGGIPEAAYANLFWVKDKMLFTADRDVLRGITRESVLRAAKKLGIRCVFRTPKLEDLLAADEVFLTKSTTGIVPVIRIDETFVAGGKMGVVTEKLMTFFPS